MKIDPNNKRKDLSQAFKKQLWFVDTINVKSSVITAILVLYDAPLLLGMLSIGEIEFLWIHIPFIVILHLWGIRLLIKNPYSTQFEMVRFMGVLGIFGALTFYVLSQGMSYFAINISSVWYYIIVNFSILVLSYILVKFQIDKYSGNPTKEHKVSDQSKYQGLLAIAPAIGYMLAHSTKDSNIQYVITLIAFYFLSLLYVYIAAKFIHRYYFLKANIDYVNFQTPAKKDCKDLIKKGVEIK